MALHFTTENEAIIEKFQSITGISERKYAKNHHNASDLATFAAERAIDDANIDPEQLDYIIVGHNFGDVTHGHNQSDMLPALAARVKHQLGIQNPSCVAYDLIFGCPGWVEGVIQAQAFIKAGMAKRCLVIGAETLSRVVDHNDRDSMIFADGAGATIIEEKKEMGDYYPTIPRPIQLMKPIIFMQVVHTAIPKMTTPNTSKWKVERYMSLR